jgi:4-amino-4-deoxy-L-arabinose transferase-like glycosyltransferase
MKTSRSFESFLRSRCLESLALCAIVLLPRVLGLMIFLTADEFNWLGTRTGHFSSAILSGDWTGTYRRYHPGVTLMWMITIGFTFQYLIQSQIGLIEPISLAGFLKQATDQPINPVFLPWGRLPVALATSACIVTIYLLLNKLFSRRIAFLATILLSLDPFYLAFCRLALPDAPLSSLTCVSLLSFMVYLWRGRRVRYLALSGLAVGLALLTKSPAILLAPAVGLASLAVPCKLICRSQTNWRKEGLHLFVALLVWVSIAGVVFFALWPAMWIAPISTVGRMLDQAAHEAAGGWPSFFMGHFTTNPPPWFYLVVLLIRTTPLTLAGFIALLLSFLVGDFEADLGQAWRGKALMLLTYVVIFTAFIAAWANKAERFLLPVFPPICILAALGIAYWVPKVIARLKLGHFAGARFWQAGASVALILQAAWSVPHHPYYLSFYNPVFGGGFLTPKVILVGLGEGLDQAARYLNVKGSSVRVASWYPECFDPFFLGQSFPLSKDSVWGNELDYVVLYINQVQRQLLDPQLAQCFDPLEPEYTVRIKGIDYAWIYKVPKPLPDCFMPAQYVQQTQFGDQILFLGYDMATTRAPFDGKLRINLYWRALREMGEDYTIYLKLINGVYHVWGQQDSRPCWDGSPTNGWKKGQVVEDKREIDVLPGTPPGLYQVEIILYDLHSGQTLEPMDGEKPLLGPVEIPRWESLSVEALGIEHPIKADLGDKVSLLGYNIESGFRPGDNIHLTLFWRCLEETGQSYTVFTHLVDVRDNIVAQKDNPPVDGFYPATRWEPEEIIRDQYDLIIPPATPLGKYRIEVGMYLAETGERLPLLSNDGSVRDDKVMLGTFEVISHP